MSLLVVTGCTKKVADSGVQQNIVPEKKEIVFYNLFDAEDALRGQIQAYESAHKDIKITYKKFQSVEEYQKLLLNELAEGRGPDIFAIRNDWMPNYWRKLTPAPASVLIPEKFAETFLGVANDDLVRADEKGLEQVWGIPLFIDTLAIYYNKQLFRDNLPSTNKPAETWDALKEQVFALAKQDNSIERFTVAGIAMGLAANISAFPDIFSLLLLQEGADLYDASGAKTVFAKNKGVSAGTGKPFFPTLEALKLYTSFASPSARHFSWNLPITALYPEQKEIGAFARGKVAMIFGFSSAYSDIKVAIDGLARENEPTIQLENIGISEVPQFEGAKEAGRRDAFAKYFPLVVSKNSPYSSEAWDFLQFLSSPESLTTYNEKTQKPTSRLDMIEEESTEKTFGAFARQAPYAKSLQTLDPDQFFAIFATLMDEVVKNNISPEQAIDQAEKQIDCVLAKRKKPELDQNCLAL